MDRTLRHEAVHVDQWTRLGRARFLWRYLTDVWLTAAVISASALLSPWLLLALPWSLVSPRVKGGRLRLEAEAFAESARWWLERGQDRLETRGGVTGPVGAYAEALHSQYALGPLISVDRCRREIEDWIDRPD